MQGIQKANIFNRQFISVLTDDTKTSLPDLGPSQYPSMEDITVSCDGVVKPLKNRKPRKAAGPDDILLMLLREAAVLRHGVRHLSYNFLRRF